MPQELFQILVAAISLMGGWILKTIWDAVRDQQGETRALAEKVAGVEILIVGQFVRRDELAGLLDRIDHKLDQISSKLDSKADR